jgi:hypothetical protein
MNTKLITLGSFLRVLPKYSSLLLMLVLFPSQQLIADERAKKGKCYITAGFVENQSLVEAAAKKLFINFDDFELFERKDKKIYLTIGKAEKKLFDKLKSDGKTFDFNCSQGKGFQKRYSFDENFKLVEGRKKFIDFESDYFAVIASIEAEKKRLVDAEVQRQVEARMEAMRLAEIKKQEQAAAEKERLRLAEIARKKKAETERLAAIEEQRQAEAKLERQRLAAIEKAKEDEIRKQKQAESDRLAAAEKAKKDKEFQEWYKENRAKEEKASAERKRKLAAERAKPREIFNWDCVNDKGMRTHYFRKGPGESWTNILYVPGNSPDRFVGTLRLIGDEAKAFILKDIRDGTVSILNKDGKDGLQMAFGMTMNMTCKQR